MIYFNVELYHFVAIAKLYHVHAVITIYFFSKCDEVFGSSENIF